MSGDGCSELCEVESGWSVEVMTFDDDGVEKVRTFHHSTCGDGFVVGDEQCDDFNEFRSDGCSSDCLSIEEGFYCQPDSRSLLQ